MQSLESIRREREDDSLEDDVRQATLAQIERERRDGAGRILIPGEDAMIIPVYPKLHKLKLDREINIARSLLQSWRWCELWDTLQCIRNVANWLECGPKELLHDLAAFNGHNMDEQAYALCVIVGKKITTHGKAFTYTNPLEFQEWWAEIDPGDKTVLLPEGWVRRLFHAFTVTPTIRTAHWLSINAGDAPYSLGVDWPGVSGGKWLDPKLSPRMTRLEDLE